MWPMASSKGSSPVEGHVEQSFQKLKPLRQDASTVFSTRCRPNIYISLLCCDVSVRLSVCLSVCDGSALWSRCMPERGEGSSRAMLATARPSRLVPRRNCKMSFTSSSSFQEAKMFRFFSPQCRA